MWAASASITRSRLAGSSMTAANSSLSIVAIAS